MERHKFGFIGRGVAAIGQGTWYDHDDDRASAVAALKRGLDVGMTHIDTAEMYWMGEAERVVGEAIFGRRDEVFLVSKVLPENASKKGTIEACERSLERLRTDRLDCYLLHWRGEYLLEDTVAAFEALHGDGKILSWGVSNFDVQDLEEVWEFASDGGPVCNQVLYHLQERAIEHAVLPWCEAHEMAVVGYAPFGHGKFPEPNSAGAVTLQEIADAHQATLRQVALKFLIRRPSLFTIPKTTRPKRAEENARADEVQLTEKEIKRIERAFPLGPPPSKLPVL